MNELKRIDEWPEMWQDIPNFVGLYKISNYGEIFYFSNGGGILKTFVGNNGYLNAHLFNRGHYYNFSVHRIVATVFIENPLKLEQVEHDDGNKLNNFFLNLKWVTQAQNMEIMHKKLEDWHARKLDKEKYFALLSEKGRFKYQDLANKFNLSVGTVFKICSGQSYKKWFNEYAETHRF